jgi:hypothetical protein
VPTLEAVRRRSKVTGDKDRPWAAWNQSPGPLLKEEGYAHARAAAQAKADADAALRRKEREALKGTAVAAVELDKGDLWDGRVSSLVTAAGEFSPSEHVEAQLRLFVLTCQGGAAAMEGEDLMAYTMHALQEARGHAGV